MDDVLDEVKLAFADEIGLSKGLLSVYPFTTRRLTSTDWKPFSMSQKAHRIVTRAANRILVGAPLCRNEVRAAAV